MRITDLDATVSIARALGHPARLRAVAMLRFGELCACQITEVLQLAPSTVSLHLKELRRAGLISERKEGRWVHFGLSEDADARPWIDAALRSVVEDPQLEADERMVDALRRLPVEDLCRLGYEAAVEKQRSLAAGDEHGAAEECTCS